MLNVNKLGEEFSGTAESIAVALAAMRVRIRPVLESADVLAGAADFGGALLRLLENNTRAPVSDLR